jgi:hypothetical protein
MILLNDEIEAMNAEFQNFIQHSSFKIHTCRSSQSQHALLRVNIAGRDGLGAVGVAHLRFAGALGLQVSQARLAVTQLSTTRHLDSFNCRFTRLVSLRHLLFSFAAFPSNDTAY